jgi:hypothetical protein
VQIPVTVQQSRQAQPVPPVRVKRVAQEPDENGYAAAAQWTIELARPSDTNLSNVFLRLKYLGDVARFYAGDQLVTDDFYSGLPLEIGLKTIRPEQAEKGLKFEVLPLRKDAPIYLAPGSWPPFADGGQVSQLNGVQAFPEYELTMKAASQDGSQRERSAAPAVQEKE